MRLRLRGIDIEALLVALFAVQLCRTPVIAAAEEEQALREWLETFYRLAEERYFAFTSASWDFNVNISAENKQRMVSGRVDRCQVGVLSASGLELWTKRSCVRFE